MRRELTYREARLLTRARWLLADLAKAADDDVMSAALHDEGLPKVPWDGYQLGLIHERCDHADDAIYDALSSLANYGDDQQARVALDAQREVAA